MCFRYRAELIRSLDRYIDFEDKFHSGPFGYFKAQGLFFDLFLASFPEGPKISFFFVFGTLFEISKLIRVRFGSQNGVPEGTFWRFLGEVARVEISDSFFVVFSTKTANTQKVKTSIFTAMRSVS